MVVAVVGVTVVVAASAGCHSNKSNTTAPTATSAPSESSAPGPAPAAAAPQVTVDGQNLNVAGPVTCTAAGGNTNIGIGDAANGVGAVVSNGNPPIVHAVGLGSVNGITLGFADAQGGNTAGAAVDGKSYQIKGTAVGVDMSNPQQPKQVTKPFQMDVTCP